MRNYQSIKPGRPSGLGYLSRGAAWLKGSTLDENILRPEQRNNFDLLRLLLAVLVVFSHSFAFVGSADTEPAWVLTRHQQTLGGISVDCFFIISGFLITASWQRSGSLLSYLRKRCYRIYPGFLGVAVVTAIVIVPLSGGEVEGIGAHHGFFARTVQVMLSVIRLSQFHTNGTFLLNPEQKVNGSLWTIRYEFICYLVVAALGLVGIYRRRIVVFILLLILLPLPSISVDDWPRLGLMYVTGMLAWLYRDRIHLNDMRTIIAILSLVIAARVPHLWEPAFAVAGSQLVFTAAYSKGLRRLLPTTERDLSYGIYLYSCPIQQVIVTYFHPVLPITLFLLASPLIVMLALLSWHLVESPFLKKKSRFEATPKVMYETSERAAAGLH